MIRNNEDMNKIGEVLGDTPSTELQGDEIVISGVAGIFPKADNTSELMDNLYNKVDMVSAIDNPFIKHPGLPEHVGKLKGWNSFDSQFFRVSAWETKLLDPLSRKTMEAAFSAVYDSGVNPVTLVGTRVGIFIGSSCPDCRMNVYNTTKPNGFVMTGCSPAMLANRISYWMDSKGPSMSIDTACTSSMACLELAYNRIKNGDCEAAIVGGCNRCSLPMLSLNHKNGGRLCLDGKTKCFDKHGDGYVRSEAVNVLFLQKAKYAKRIYAEVCHVKGKYFTRPDAIFLPIRKPEDVIKFLEEFYSNIKVSPSQVEYVEAFGSGIAEADASELESIGRFFAKSRSVKVGSIKSNMGHTEGAAGVCSVTKLCLAYHKGVLPANLHYKDPQEHIPAIRDGRIQVVTDNNDNNETISLARDFKFYSGITPEVWFLYSGMGSQWNEMGRELLQIPIFAAAINRCRKVLELVGVDLVEILTSPQKSVFEKNMFNAMVGITAIQIGLTDILKAIGIVPDYIIGHSFGELACAYADGSLTAEEAILSSCQRGLVSMNGEYIRGSMAAVGLGYKEVMRILPPEIEVACHNSSKSSTLSGPYDVMQNFMTLLKCNGVFVKELQCSNIPYHSKHIAHAGPEFLAAMKKCIINPKLRSAKWISTSVPQHRSDEPWTKYASPEYFVNNLLNPVYFEENSTAIPKGAVVIEIAPHGLLQAIMKNMPQKIINVSLVKRDYPKAPQFLLEALGKLYTAGLTLQIDVLYPEVKFPVSTGTPLLSHLVSWDHSVNWPEIKPIATEIIRSSLRNIDISLCYKEYSYLKDHLINGMNEISEGALLVLIWQTFGMVKGKFYEDTSVTFSDIKFYKPVIIESENVLTLTIMIQKSSNQFEVSNNDVQIVTGTITDMVDKDRMVNVADFDNIKAYSNEEEIYTVLCTRGYSYGGEFRSIYSINEERNQANIKTTNRWSTFIDSLIQLNVFARDHDGVSRPKIINTLNIDIEEHNNEKKIIVENISCYNAELTEVKTITRCAGVELRGIILNDEPKIEYYADENSLKRRVYPLVDSKSLNGNLLVPKFEESSAFLLTRAVINNVDKFAWIATPFASSSRKELIQISYAGLSIKDTQKAFENIEHNNASFGFDFSGTNSRGERVMGLVNAGAVATVVEADSTLLWPIPKYWRMEDAATVPLAYIHAYYCLAIRNQLYSHQSVLVTNGDQPLGQAFIAVCLSLGCAVFTIVDNMESKNFLLRLFPKLKEENVFLCGHEEFFVNVNYLTNKKRCDFVIDCGSSDLKESTVKCVGFMGTFLDLTNHTPNSNTTLEMYNLEEERTYRFINVANLFKHENINERKKIQKILAEGISKGIVQPLRRVVFSYSEVPRAFKLMAAKSYIHPAVLIKMEDYNSLNSNIPVIQGMDYSEGVYIVIYDKMNLSIELLSHIIIKGAKNIVLHVKPDHDKKYLLMKLRSWTQYDVSIKINSDNLNTMEGCQRLLTIAEKMGPVTGIFIVEDNEKHSLTDIFEPLHCNKTIRELDLAVNNLDLASRTFCPNLRHFVLAKFLPETNNRLHRTLSAFDKIHQARVDSGLPALLISIVLPNKGAKLEENLLLTIKLPALSRLFNSMDWRLKLKHNDLLFDISNSYKEVENSSKIQYVNENFSLETLYNFIENDECIAVDAVIPMKTQLNSATHEEINKIMDSTHLMMIPGFDGDHRLLKCIAERLKVIAMTVQMGPDMICDSLTEIAEILTKRIKLHFKKSSKFYLLGYSFGVNVALEVAKLLETEGYKGVVYCFDNSPDALKLQINLCISNLKGASLQNAVIENMYTLITGKKSEYLKHDIENIDEWSKKVDICLNRLKGHNHFSIQHKKCLIEAALNKIVLAQEYDPKFKLESELILLKNKNHAITADQLPEDYNLSKYTKQPVKILNIESDIATVINNTLGSDLLDKFNRTNLCETYYI